MFKPNDVITVKLVTGEEIIGYFEEMNDKWLSIRKPMTLVAQSTGAALAPFLMTGESMDKNIIVRVNMATTVAVVDTNNYISKEYVRQVSGIDLSADNNSRLIM